MENLGAVSLWFGNCSTEDLLRKYVEIKYDNKGDRIPSSFMNDFKIDFLEYNQDLFECTYNEYPTSSFSELLKNASYSDELISKLKDFYGESSEKKYNIVIRLYDFEYEELVEEAKLDGRNLKYMESVIYED
ncbi:immunity 22 family protein [Fictibacillus sp. 5RED26]|uniref:immunity 22 family protein n=1 Tax=Fictibacillus sp. 5RED26 TaxID=2745876 RepID=UPI0018CF70EE|nr:immunity 22 family protein [Fictibacillus sp. 5RED26]MBH0156651.1 immunity 22 family protein [Fictibacillus sp. 5RED26]